MVIAATEDEADRKLRAGAAKRGWSEEQYRVYAVAGEPAAVAEQARAYLDAGLDGLLFNMPDAYDLDAVAMAGKTLSAVISG